MSSAPVTPVCPDPARPESVRPDPAVLIRQRAHGHDRMPGSDSPVAALDDPVAETGSPVAAGECLRPALTEPFRLHGPDDPDPGPRRLGWVCAWAGGLGVGGLVIVIRILIGMLAGLPAWYLPTITGIGLFGVACTTGALASVHRRDLPWPLLGLATVILVAAWSLTGLTV